MDYEKKYKEALERAKVMHEEGMMTERLEYLFPELAESEDEKIRKELLKHCTNAVNGVTMCVSTADYARWLAWLEKQGQKPFDYENANIQQKDFAPKQEPKFKLDDWVVTDKNNIVQIKAVNNGYYAIDNGMDFDSSYVDRCWNLWTIEDAKDGDVLYHKSESGIEYIVMSKGLNENNNIDSYFRYNSIDGFGIDIPSVLSAKSDSITPATKEQCDLLFQKMHEAGYEWDDEKKELKTIDARENLTLDGDLMEVDCMIVEQKPEPKPVWSKEDELHIRELESLVKQEWVIAEHENDKETIHKMSDLSFFLKTLKPQLKQKWNEEDEAKLKSACALIRNTSLNGNEDIVDSTIDWLKSLKQRIGE